MSLRPPLVVYAIWLAMPCAFLAAGWFLRARPIFDIAGWTVLVLAPLAGIGLTFWVLGQARIVVDDEAIRLTRFRLWPFGRQAVTVPFASLRYGVLANSRSVRDGLLARSGLQGMPLSVLYLEYGDGQAVVAYNVANFDNRHVLRAFAGRTEVDSANYRMLPRL